MNNDFLSYSQPDITEAEIEAVAATLRSGWVTTGPKCKQFEEEFVSFLGGGLDAVAVNSATAGLHLVLEALGVGPGDEVIVPTLTFTATAEVVRYLGADVVFVDVDPSTLNIDVGSVRAAISERSKVIIPVHYGGLACNMEEICLLANSFGLKVVEDAAHALPSTRNGCLVGTLNTAATVFSFYANKTMTTGEGGMVVTRDSGLASRMRIMRLHGIDRDAFDRFRSHRPAWYYEIVAPGFKYNLTDIAASMGLVQLRRLPGFLARRQELASRYRNGLADLPVIMPPEPPFGDVHSWHLYVIRLLDCSAISRDEVIVNLSKRGIGTSVHYVPLHRQPYWRDRYGLLPERFPVAEQAFASMISLPLYTTMSDGDVDRVLNALREIVGIR